ncbi:MAG: DUF1428 domain-containing protein [Pseudomonadota bacterium]
MTYVDGFLCAVPAAAKQAFIDHCELALPYFIKHGATRYMECWGDDVPQGTVNSMHTAVQCKDNEVVCFSWIEWPDKAARDAGMEAVMADMAANGADMTEMPFDGKRMIFGGFVPVAEASA